MNIEQQVQPFFHFSFLLLLNSVFTVLPLSQVLYPDNSISLLAIQMN